MKFGERLDAALKHLGWGPSDLSGLTSVAMPTISAITTRGSDRTNYKEALIRGFPADKISHEWLRAEVGSMVPAKSAEMQAPPEPSNVADAPALAPSRLIPVVGHVKGGDDGYLEEMLFPVGHGEGFVPYWTKDRAAYALRVRGDSMHPRYRAREFVVVTPSIEAQQGNDVVVRLKDGRKLLKQLNWKRDGEVQLLSINNGFAPMTIQMSDVESIHRVAGGVPPDAFQDS